MLLSTPGPSRANNASPTEATHPDPHERSVALMDWHAAWYQSDDFRGCPIVRAVMESIEPLLEAGCARREAGSNLPRTHRRTARHARRVHESGSRTDRRRYHYGRHRGPPRGTRCARRHQPAHNGYQDARLTSPTRSLGV